jgi:hypothetical protein
MGSGGNRNSRMIVAGQSESHRGQDPEMNEMGEQSDEMRYAERYARNQGTRISEQSNLDSTENLLTNSADFLPIREETLSLMTSLHQSHLDELEQRKTLQMLTENQPTNFGRNLSTLMSTESQPTNFGNLSSSSVADPVFPRGESRSPSCRPLPSRGAFEPNLTPFSNNLNLNPGSKPYESVERKVRGGIDNVDNWRRIERDAPAQMNFSTRKGRVSVDNITQRDSKRPSERPRDRDYHRRFSGVFPNLTVRNDAVHVHDRSPPLIRLGGHSWPNEHSPSPTGRTTVQVNFRNSNGPIQPPSSGRHGQREGSLRPGDRGYGAYYVSLICAGDTIQVLVWPTMLIAELIDDAGRIFGLEPTGIYLLLFTTPPTSLRRDSTISGPPLVAPDASVMVFCHQTPPTDQAALRLGSHTPHIREQSGTAITRICSLRQLLR